MFLRKIIHGTVTQVFDTEKGQFIGQNFAPTDNPVWEDTNGEPSLTPENDPALLTDMLQPDNIQTEYDNINKMIAFCNLSKESIDSWVNNLKDGKNIPLITLADYIKFDKTLTHKIEPIPLRIWNYIKRIFSC